MEVLNVCGAPVLSAARAVTHHVWQRRSRHQSAAACNSGIFVAAVQQTVH